MSMLCGPSTDKIYCHFSLLTFLYHQLIVKAQLLFTLIHIHTVCCSALSRHANIHTAHLLYTESNDPVSPLCHCVYVFTATTTLLCQ